MGSYHRHFEFDELPVLQPDKFQHRMARHRYRKGWHQRVWHEVLVREARPPKPLDYAVVRLVRHSSREPDEDNLYYSFKPIVDGFVRAGVLRSDSRDAVQMEPDWSRAPRGGGRVTVEIVETTRSGAASDREP